MCGWGRNLAPRSGTHLAREGLPAPGRSPGRVGSHGCVKPLPAEIAQLR